MTRHNGHDPASVPEEQRDYIAEAMRIVAKQTMLLPETAHLQALVDELASLRAIAAMQNRGLIALLLSIRQPGFVVSVDSIKKIEAKALDIAIKRETGGPITVTLIRPGPPQS